MDTKKLTRTINSVGKECFVNYFPLFNDRAIPNSEVAEIIRKERGYTEKACKSRTAHSRMIIDSGKSIEALKIIIGSDKLDTATILLAKERLHDITR